MAPPSETTDDYKLVQDSAVATAQVQPTSTPMVEVVAPATLQEGYTFVAQMGDRTFTVQVPAGGVTKGQKFLVALPIDRAATNEPLKSTIPEHQWRDRLFDCCRHGVCHPLLWNALFCPAIALAQVMTRMNLNWFGHPEGSQGNGKTFKKVLYLLIIYFTVDTILDMIIKFQVSDYYSESNMYYDQSSANNNGDPPNIQGYVTFHQIWQLAFIVYLVYAMTKTRIFIRERYNIPGTVCEDCCCSFWCSCCTVSQMARHTADYHTYPSVCCSETGLPDGVETV